MTGKDIASNRVAFRNARAEDLPELVRMLADDPLGSGREAWPDPVAAGYADAFAAIEADPDNELVVAVLDDAVVGMLQLTFVPSLTYQGRWRALIEGVRVASRARSRGMGAAMFAWAIERARARAASRCSPPPTGSGTMRCASTSAWGSWRRTTA